MGAVAEPCFLLGRGARLEPAPGQERRGALRLVLRGQGRRAAVLCCAQVSTPMVEALLANSIALSMLYRRFARAPHGDAFGEGAMLSASAVRQRQSMRLYGGSLK